MSIWVIALFVIVAFFALGGILSSRDSKRDAERAVELLAEVERKYEDFISKRFYNLALSEFDPDKLVNEAMILIKPEIDSLIMQIDASNSTVDLNINSLYFKNAVSFTESLFVESKKNKKLSAQNKTDFVDSFKSAILADLTSRRLELGS